MELVPRRKCNRQKVKNKSGKLEADVKISKRFLGTKSKGGRKIAAAAAVSVLVVAVEKTVISFVLERKCGPTITRS